MKKENKIKICHIASSDLTVKFLLLSQLKFLKSQGYDVYAVCSRGKWVKSIEKEGIKVKVIEIQRKISPFSDLVCLFKLIVFLRKERFSIVHTHTPKPSLLGQMAAKIAGVPIIVNTIHGFYFHDKTPYFQRKFFILIEKIAAMFSTMIFSQNRTDVNTAIHEKIAKIGKIKFLGNGIDLKRFDAKRFSKTFILKKKKSLLINPKQKVIGIVGRLVEEKGYVELFEAFSHLKESFPKTLLLIIGQKEHDKKDSLDLSLVKRYEIEKSVMFLGEREDIDEIYPLMDVFVLPSWREGFPRSILEASAFSKPVIATDIRGCKDAVENKKTGVLVLVKDPQSLYKAMSYFLLNPKIMKLMGKNGRKKAEKEFDEELVFDKIKTEYLRLIKEKL